MRFVVHVAERRAIECNCSMCTMKGFVHLVVDRESFELVRGRSALAEYRFGTYVARHWFCRHCGVHPFYRPRSHPSAIDVNVRCLDAVDLAGWSIEAFDGRHWEANVDALRGAIGVSAGDGSSDAGDPGRPVDA